MKPAHPLFHNNFEVPGWLGWDAYHPASQVMDSVWHIEEDILWHVGFSVVRFMMDATQTTSL